MCLNSENHRFTKTSWSTIASAFLTASELVRKTEWRSGWTPYHWKNTLPYDAVFGFWIFLLRMSSSTRQKCFHVNKEAELRLQESLISVQSFNSEKMAARPKHPPHPLQHWSIEARCHEKIMVFLTCFFSSKYAPGFFWGPGKLLRRPVQKGHRQS